jgi:hypothetical protein
MERRAVDPVTTRVLYVLGWGRSGSTVLANILGEIEGFFAVGELHYLWERGLLEGRLCGCGRTAEACEIWSEILRRVGVGSQVDPAEVTGWLRDTLRIRQTPRLLRLRRGVPLAPPALARYAALTERVYAEVREVTGARVVVDSSKIPADAALLPLLPGVDPYYVQLVRDPRAVAFSWARVKDHRDPNAPAVMVRHGTLDSGANWTTWNLLAEGLARKVGPGRFLRVRYEDLVAQPRTTVATIARMVGAAEAELPFEDEHTARLGPNHTVSGNPDRFRTGPTTLRSDDEWMRAQAAQDRWITTALALPLMRRYRYPVRLRTASA